MHKKTRRLSKFRIRGYRCGSCGIDQNVYGDVPAPEVCNLSPCMGKPKLLFDQNVTQTVDVEDNLK
jgi:hypothetical protein